jgi:hypothetical protein
MIKEHYPKIYDKYFNKNDINKLLKFYKSQTGQKLLQVSPDIQKEFVQIMMNKYMPEFQKKIDEKKNQIKEQIR